MPPEEMFGLFTVFWNLEEIGSTYVSTNNFNYQLMTGTYGVFSLYIRKIALTLYWYTMNSNAYSQYNSVGSYRYYIIG